MSFNQLIKTQFVPASIEEVWDFISSPKNLKEITPDYMGFDIISDNLTDKMYPGMIIRYKVRPVLGIPLAWVSEITHIVEGRYFIDEQRIGPYAMWHHQHLIEPDGDGVMMTDIISYKPPMGFLGSIANWLFIKSQLEDIFAYRKAALDKRFPGS